MLPRLAADYRALVSDLWNEAVKHNNDVHRVRTELRRLLGEEIPLTVLAWRRPSRRSRNDLC